MDARMVLLASAVSFSAAPSLVIGQVVDESSEVGGYTQIMSVEEFAFEQVPAQPDAPEATTELINGIVVDPINYPGVLRMTTGGTCTASLVGPSTVLLAAHCVPNGSSVHFKFAGTPVQSRCIRAPGYDSFRHTNDVAACILRYSITDVKYETLNLTTEVASGATVHPAGYGCTAKGNPLDRKLRIGVSTIIGERSVRDAGLTPHESELYSYSSIEAGEAVLCPGDSGGPLFCLIGDNTKREICGFASKTTYEYGYSIYAKLSAPTISAFVKYIADAYDQKICGYNMEFGCVS